MDAPFRKKIDQRDPDAIEGMVEHGSGQADLAEADEGVTVEHDDGVIDARTEENQRRVQDVEQKRC